MIEVIQDFIPVGRHNRPGRLMQPKYITIHDTGNPDRGADALAHAKYVKGDTAANLPVSWHFTVDGHRAVQHLPLNETGYHAGDSVGNNSSIGIEICENADGDAAAAEDNAAQLAAQLLKQFDLPLSAVVPHKAWNNKQCPHIILARPNGWEEFIAKVRSFMDTNTAELEAQVASLKATVALLESKIAKAREALS